MAGPWGIGLPGLCAYYKLLKGRHIRLIETTKSKEPQDFIFLTHNLAKATREVIYRLSTVQELFN